MLDKKDLSPIHFKRVGAGGKEVPYDRIVKGYEYEKGQYVIMNEADFKAANVKATQTLDIEDFVLIEEIDPMLFEKPYYMVPQKGGEKGYYLLRDALEEQKKVAVGKIVIRTKQHLALIMVRGEYLVLEMLRFAHEVVQVKQAEYLEGVDKAKTKYSPRELKMAEELIKSMTNEWEPEKYEDTYYDDLLKRIKAKVKAGEGHEVEDDQSTEEEAVKPTKVIDLLPLLRQSIASKKKPAAGKGRASARAH